MPDNLHYIIIGAVVIGALLVIPLIVVSFLKDVPAGTIRLVSWLQGSTVIYRGPGKSKEVPLFTTGTTISSKVINIDLDITDQTADVDDNGTPRPIKVRTLLTEPLESIAIGNTSNPWKKSNMGLAPRNKPIAVWRPFRQFSVMSESRLRH